MSQQYRTADGSIWECLGNQGDGDQFSRIGSPDGGHENDFRSQSLDEVLRYGGAMSLFDPLKHQAGVLADAMVGTGMVARSRAEEKSVDYVTQLDKMGYEIVRKDRDD